MNKKERKTVPFSYAVLFADVGGINGVVYRQAPTVKRISSNLRPAP